MMRTRKTALTEQSFKQSLEGKEFMSPSCGGPVRINGGRVVLNGYEDVTDSCDWSKLMDESQAWNIGGAYQRMTASDASTESSRYIAHIGDRVRYQTEDGSEGEGILQDVQLGMDNGFHDNFYIIKKDDGEEARIPTFSLLMFQKVSMKKTSDINPDDYSYETYYDEIGKLDSEGREVRWLNVNRTGPKGSHQVASIPVHEGQTDPMRLIEDLKAVDRMGMEGREWSEAFNRVFDKYMVPGMGSVISASGMGELYRYSSKRTASELKDADGNDLQEGDTVVVVANPTDTGFNSNVKGKQFVITYIGENYESRTFSNPYAGGPVVGGQGITVPAACVRKEEGNAMKTAASLADFEVGDKVTHAKWGDGEVTYVGSGPNGDKVSVDFTNPLQSLMGPAIVSPNQLKKGHSGTDPWGSTASVKKTALTGWLEGKSEEEIKAMPVQVVFEDPSGRGLKSEEYPNFQAALSAGHDFIRPNDWQNAMKGVSYETNATVLRFESPEAYRILSASKRTSAESSTYGPGMESGRYLHRWDSPVMDFTEDNKRVEKFNLRVQELMETGMSEDEAQRKANDELPAVASKRTAGHAAPDETDTVDIGNTTCDVCGRTASAAGVPMTFSYGKVYCRDCWDNVGKGLTGSKKTAVDENDLKFSAVASADPENEGMFFVDVKCESPDGRTGEWSEWHNEADAKRYADAINQNPTFQYMTWHRGMPEADMMHEAWQEMRGHEGSHDPSMASLRLGDHVTGMSITLAGKNIRVAGVLLRNEYEDIYTVRTANGDYPVIERDLKSAPKKYASIADEIQDLKGRKEMLEVEYDSAETDDQKASFTDRIDELEREINGLEARVATTDPTFFGHGLKCAEIEDGNTPTLTSPSTEEISDNADVPLSMRHKGEPGEGSEYRTKISRRRRTAEDAIKAGDDVVVFADAAHEIGQYGGKVVEVKPNGYAMVESYKFPGDPEAVGLAWVEKISPEEAADWGKVGSKRIAGQTICRKCGVVFVPTTDDPVEEAEDLGWEIGQIGGYVTFENSLCPDCRKRRKSGSVRSADNGAAPTIGGAPEGLDDVEGEKKTAEVELDENIFESEDDAPHRFRGEEKDQSVMRSSSDGAKGYQSSGPFVAPPSALPGAYASCPTGIPKDVKDEVIPKTYMTLNKIKDDMKEGKTASFMGDQMDEIFKAKVEQYVAEGMSEEEAKKKAEDAVLSEYSFWTD